MLNPRTCSPTGNAGGRRNAAEAGFTLLETIIAIAIMTISFASIILIQRNSIAAIERSREETVVTLLARNIMIDTDLLIEGKDFKEVKEEESGTFDRPFEQYKWKRKIKEIEFPQLNFAGAAGSEEGATEGEGDASSTDASTETVTKLITQFLSKAVREITVTISYPRGTGTVDHSITTYWVDLNHEFSLTEQ
jgi:prepilin-type N-terminal cleavage/methylation domain-containing protein